MVEFKQLYYFATVAELSSFSKAASKLFISQPALSQQISKLEEQLGVLLIKRNTRSIQLTLSGKELFNRSTVLLRDMENMLHAVKNVEINSEKNLELKVALEDGIFSMCGTGLFEAIAAYQQKHSEYQIKCFPVGEDEILQAVASGITDIGFAYNPISFRLPQNLDKYSFCQGRLALAVPMSWGFQVNSKEFYDSINNSTLYYPAKRSCWHGIISSYFSRHSFYPHNVLLENYETAINYTMCGKGVFFAPEIQLKQYSERCVRVLPVDDPSMGYRVSMFFKKHDTNIAVHYMLDLLKNEF